MGTDPTRNPAAVVEQARTVWADWQPGDGSRYAVHIVTISGGAGRWVADESDLVLLLSIQRRTYAFQSASVAYRLAESPRWSWKRCKAEGIPRWVWEAACPLLHQLGVVGGRA